MQVPPRVHWTHELQKQFLDQLHTRLNFKSWSDWYKVKPSDIRTNGGQGILDIHKNIPNALSHIYPEHKWKLFKFGGVPHSYWADHSNQKDFINDFAEEFRLRSAKDWYRIKADDLRKHGGSGLIQHYGGSYIKAIQSLVPEIKFQRGKFQNDASSDHLRLFPDRKRVLEEIGVALHVKTPEDWYGISNDQVLAMKLGPELLGYYEGSLISALTSIYSDFPFRVHRFEHFNVPRSYWKDVRHQREFFDDLAVHLHIQKPEDWYGISTKTVMGRPGAYSLMYYYPNVFEALMAAYPEFNFELSKFQFQPYSDWKDPNVVRRFMDKMKEKYKVESVDDWYQFPKTYIRQNGGEALLKQYGDSVCKILEKAYPDQVFESDQFMIRGEGGYWKNKKLQRQFFDRLEDYFGIVQYTDWYRIRISDVVKAGGKGVLAYYGNSLHRALESIYPEHPWNLKSPSLWWNADPIGKAQVNLSERVRGLFPEEEVFDNFILSSGREKIEVDVAIPSLNLAFEYQGEQHYQERSPNSPPVFGDPALKQKKDEAKRLFCEENGISLIIVPYWWDGKAGSLAATLKSKRSDLLQDARGDPIPLSPP